MEHTCFISSIQLSHYRHLKCDLAEVKCQLLVDSWLDFSDTSVEELNNTWKKTFKYSRNSQFQCLLLTQLRRYESKEWRPADHTLVLSTITAHRLLSELQCYIPWLRNEKVWILGQWFWWCLWLSTENVNRGTGSFRAVRLQWFQLSFLSIFN